MQLQVQRFWWLKRISLVNANVFLWMWRVGRLFISPTDLHVTAPMWTGCLLRWDLRLCLINKRWICNPVLNSPLLFLFQQLHCTRLIYYFFHWVHCLNIQTNYCKLLTLLSPLLENSLPLRLQKSTTNYRLGLWERSYRWWTPVFCLSVCLLFFYRDLLKANLPSTSLLHPPHCTSVPTHSHCPLNDRRHLALWTCREPVQDEMEAYFGKPTKALKCKPPAACLATDVFVLVERAAVAFHRGTRQKRRAMCGLLIFKPPVCQVSALGMRPRTHTHTRTHIHMPNLFPTIPLSVCLSHMDWC